LHFIGNQFGKIICDKVSAVIVGTPIVISVPALGGCALCKESQTANCANEQMQNYQSRCPNSTMAEQYKVYTELYKLHANSSIIGRQLTKFGVM